jgi:hypothetical protein
MVYKLTYFTDFWHAVGKKCWEPTGCQLQSKLRPSASSGIIYMWNDQLKGLYVEVIARDAVEQRVNIMLTVSCGRAVHSSIRIKMSHLVSR